MHPTRSTSNPHAVDNTDWLKTAAPDRGFGWPFRPFLRLKTIAGGAFWDAWLHRRSSFLPPTHRAGPFRLTDLARFNSPPEQLERRLDLTCIPFELHTHPHCMSYVQSSCKISVGLPFLAPHSWRCCRYRVRPPAQRICGPDFGLYHRMYVNALSTFSDTAQSKARYCRALDGKERWPRSPPPPQLPRLSMSGRKTTIFSFSHNQLAVLFLEGDRPLACVCSCAARAAFNRRARCRRFPLHWATYFGNLRHPASRLRITYKAGTEFSLITIMWWGCHQCCS